MIELILVNDADEQIGTGEKLAVHQQGLLHRAFSVFIFNDEGKLLIQQRADQKYHSGGLWANTCCGHPAPDLDVVPAAEKRLSEEMGFTVPLEEIFVFQYRAELDHDLIENEVDHVLVGTYNGTFTANPEEVQNFRWEFPEQLTAELDESPEKFAAWFKIALPKVIAQKLR